MTIREQRVTSFVKAFAVASVLLRAADAAAATLPLVSQGARDAIVLTRRSYNYAPAMIRDGATYHLYWCGGLAGDTILHLSGPSPTGPWSSNSFWTRVDVALKPSGDRADFDGLHTCDPNVIAIDGTFYLYYSGLARDGALTAIGVATSTDGIHFTRAPGGRPIVVPAETDVDYAARKLTYGAGQPAVARVPPWTYLSFTDSTGSGANPINGAGQFVLRSRDPLFGRDVEELTAAGWRARRPGEHTAEYSYLQSFGLDLGYDTLSRTLLAVSDRAAGRATLFALDPATFATLATGDIAIAWREGPGLVTRADKTLAPRPACDRLPIGILAPEGASADPFSWHAIGYSAGTISMAAVCGRRS